MSKFLSLLSLLTILAPTAALAQVSNDTDWTVCQGWFQNMMGYGWPMMGGGWWGAGGAIVGLIFWILIIIVIAYVIRALMRGSHFNGMHHMTPEDSALKILKERYAKGEINKQEYEEKMKDLMK